MSTLQWLAIAGPTASGKTALALAIARRWPVEIISVDSALVYRGMDIGTAKPTPEERQQAPHHLIDIRDPAQPYSAADFVRDARALIPLIRDRGRFPLLVGGTMLYFKALFDGLDDMPPAQPDIRAELEAQAAQEGWPALHRRLAEVDPVTAQRLSPNDSQRIGRALEVYRATGQPLSSFHRQSEGDVPAEGLHIDHRPGALWALEPRDRGWLHARIGERFDAMLRQGFLEEVRRLRARGDLNENLPSMRCVGYRQAWQALEAAGDALSQDGAAMERFRERGIAATRQLAKRQLTWLRGMSVRDVWAADEPDLLDQALRQFGTRVCP